MASSVNIGFGDRCQGVRWCTQVGYTLIRTCMLNSEYSMSSCTI